MVAVSCDKTAKNKIRNTLTGECGIPRADVQSAVFSAMDLLSAHAGSPSLGSVSRIIWADVLSAVFSDDRASVCSQRPATETGPLKIRNTFTGECMPTSLRADSVQSPVFSVDGSSESDSAFDPQRSRRCGEAGYRSRRWYPDREARRGHDHRAHRDYHWKSRQSSLTSITRAIQPSQLLHRQWFT